MPTKPMKPCNHPMCPQLTQERFCADHDKLYERERTAHRLNSYQRGYTKDWAKARLYFLRRHPLCVHCLKDGKPNEATEVDHIIPHKGDLKTFWDERNWQALCKPCHSRKTMSEINRMRYPSG